MNPRWIIGPGSKSKLAEITANREARDMGEYNEKVQQDKVEDVAAQN